MQTDRSNLETPAKEPIMTITIRAFERTDEDYETLAWLHNLVYSDYPDTPEEYRFYDERREPRIRHGRLIAERGGEPVGVGVYGQSVDAYHPQRFSFEVMVNPDHQSNGVGRALMNALHDAVQPFDPIKIRSSTRADWTRAVRFLEAAGFKEEYRAWESRLDPRSFDASPYANLEKTLQADGIEMLSVRELEQMEPNWKRKLFDLDTDACRDIPNPEAFTGQNYERFEKVMLGGPDFCADAFLVAVRWSEDGSLEYLAESTLWRKPGDEHAFNGATGTRREWRGRKIALALKVKNLIWARENGVTQIKTWNGDVNRPMLSINEKLGFEKMPAWVNMVKVI
jgi:mycothiol synthase